MSLLETVNPEQAEGRVGELYNIFKDTIGFIPNAFRLYSVNPEMLEQHWQYLSYHINHPTLSGKLMVMIRLLVSTAQHCEYCVNINTHLLNKELGMAMTEILAIKNDPDNAPLEPREKALLKFVVKATLDSNSVNKSDIDVLHESGCSDQEIFDALHHGARQVAADILFNAFKIENDF